MYHKIKRTGFGATSFTEQKTWLANVVWTMGNNQLILQHQNDKDGDKSTVATQPSCKVDAFAWQYNFSKRTATYIQYAKIDNNDSGTCNSGAYPGALPTTGAGQDIKAWSLGMAINF
jgi:predicted porin